METTLTLQDRIAIATLSGDITHAVAGELQLQLMAALENATALLLDCAAIGMLTSAGLRTLLLLHRQAQAGGKRLLLAAVPPAVEEVMRVTGFWDPFQTCTTREEALAKLG